MTIDKSGRYWKGSKFDDVAEYLRLLMAESYPVERAVQSSCSCGEPAFRLDYDAEEGGAKRTCARCGAERFIADSADYWEDAKPKRLKCGCGSDTFEIGVGFSMRDEREVRWVVIGARCLRCGTLGSPADWKVDYSPSAHLTSQA